MKCSFLASHVSLVRCVCFAGCRFECPGKRASQAMQDNYSRPQFRHIDYRRTDGLTSKRSAFGSIQTHSCKPVSMTDVNERSICVLPICRIHRCRSCVADSIPKSELSYRPAGVAVKENCRVSATVAFRFPCSPQSQSQGSSQANKAAPFISKSAATGTADIIDCDGAGNWD